MEDVMYKICSKCKENKSINDFYVDKRRNKHYQHCKKCQNLYTKKWAEENKEKQIEYSQNYYQKNKEMYKENSDQWYEKNKEHKAETVKKWYNNNKERKNKVAKKWKENNRELTRGYSKKSRSNNKEYYSSYNRRRRKEDPIFKLKHDLRKRLYGSLKAKKWNKNSHFAEYIGCTAEKLKTHIESQFQPGMTWKNHGRGSDKWHLDHIIPLDSATTEEELYKLCHYTNLQPLWESDNLKKGAKMPEIAKKKENK